MSKLVSPAFSHEPVESGYSVSFYSTASTSTSFRSRPEWSAPIFSLAMKLKDLPLPPPHLHHLATASLSLQRGFSFCRQRNSSFWESGSPAFSLPFQLPRQLCFHTWLRIFCNSTFQHLASETSGTKPPPNRLILLVIIFTNQLIENISSPTNFHLIFLSGFSNSCAKTF